MGDLGFCIESVGIIYISGGGSVLAIVKEKLKVKILQDNLVIIFIPFQAELDLLIFLDSFQPEIFCDWWCVGFLLLVLVNFLSPLCCHPCSTPPLPLPTMYKPLR